jgi:DNA-binding transcriptional LysR family regulator
MTLAQIRYSLALCEELSFTRAARRCGISQPSLTNAIKSLERELNGPLFRRWPMRLTNRAANVRPHLAKALASIERAKRAARRSFA